MACLVCARRPSRVLVFESSRGFGTETVCLQCADSRPPQGIRPHPVYSGVVFGAEAGKYRLSDLQARGYTPQTSLTAAELDRCRSAVTTYQNGPNRGKPLHLYLRSDIEARGGQAAARMESLVMSPLSRTHPVAGSISAEVWMFLRE